MYMGVQYAYSDIVLATVQDPNIRRIVTLAFVIVAPMMMISFIRGPLGQGPWGTLLSAIIFTGVSFILDSIMPVAVGSLGEDMVRGVAAVMLVNTCLLYTSDAADE